MDGGMICGMITMRGSKFRVRNLMEKKVFISFFTSPFFKFFIFCSTIFIGSICVWLFMNLLVYLIIGHKMGIVSSMKIKHEADQDQLGKSKNWLFLPLLWSKLITLFLIWSQWFIL